MGSISSVRRTSTGHDRRRKARAGVALTATVALLVSPALTPSATAAAPPADTSDLRTGVLALAGAISAVGQTPELVTPLPFTTTSLADVLQLDERLTDELGTALAGENLEEALDALDGVALIPDDDPDEITFTYERTVENHPLALVHDDGDLRLGENDGAGDLDVSLVTRPSDPFVVAVDESQLDPLLRVALVSQPVMDLSVDLETDELAPFGARQGFTEVDVTGGHYRLHREQVITMRDPDGRGLLTLEDLRYSTLPDLFRVEAGATDSLDVALDLALPESLGTAGSVPADDRVGTLSLDGDSAPDGAVWPAAADATRDYGDALARATGLSMVDGLASLARYTGTVLALQDAANVPFPNLGGGTADLFAPGDDLLGLLSTAAAAQIQCGAAPENPPVGVAAPGDTVYCSAVTPAGVLDVSDVSWTSHGDGTVVTPVAAGTVGPAPTSVVQVDGSDGEPDVSVTFTADGQELTARSMPHTVQDVVRRIDALNAGSDASAALSAGRLDIAVSLARATSEADLELGNPGTLGALVGLTGLGSETGAPTLATASASGSTFDVGFGIQTGEVEEGESRETVLIPSDDSLIKIEGLGATAPTNVTDLPARVGFLAVTADLQGLGLGTTGEDDDAVTLSRTGSGVLPISTLLNEEGALDPSAVALESNVTASISFEATETPLTEDGSDYATGSGGPASGTASVTWGPRGLPQVTTGGDYDELRVFDPVPATFLSGTTDVTQGTGTEPDVVRVDLPAGTDLYDALGVASPDDDPSIEGDVEVARRLLTDGLACQNVTLLDADTLTCAELAPAGEAGLGDGDAVEMIVLGDPFALRDSVIEGLSATSASFDRLDGDHRAGDGFDADQYTSTLPLVDLTPGQLAVEREALTAGLAKIAQAATEDEAGGSGGLAAVSSAQELAAAVPSLVPADDSDGAALAYTVAGDTLGVQLSADAPAGETLTAPLRFSVDGPGQVTSDDLDETTIGDQYPVAVDSSTTLAIDVAVATGRPAVGDATGTVSTATLGVSGAPLNNDVLRAGIGDFTITGNGSTADLGVTVTTDYVPDSGELETSRANARGPARAGVAHLVVGEADTIHVEFDATDSSGGTGTNQPAPEAMQVQFLAEGLDGLASALDDALDGAAPANLDPDSGAAVSAPLIGTDLDAGADVAGILTDLTSNLRDELEDVDAATAADLESALETAVGTAVDGTDGLDDLTPSEQPSANVTCVGGTCTPCAPEDVTEEDPCETETATGWETVSVSVELTGTGKDGETQFDTGLPGLELRSDKKVATHTAWTLPITLELARGVGPRVTIADGDALELDVEAELPEAGIDAIVGYVPAHLSADGADARLETTVVLDPADGTYDLFQLYDGELTAHPSFEDQPGPGEEGLVLGFETLETGGGPLHLTGSIGLPWTADDGFDEITYDDVSLDVGAIAATMATPFEVVDPYLAPVRDVIDVLRTPIPVISDLSELAGGDEVSLLTLLETAGQATGRRELDLAYRVIGLVEGVSNLVAAIAPLAGQTVLLEDLEGVGALLSVEPSEVELYNKCTQAVSSASTTTGTPTTPTTPAGAKPKTEPCPDSNFFEVEKPKAGAPGQTTNANRAGTRNVKKDLSQRTKSVTGTVPGFSLPFLEDPDQILDMLTGEGEASYFRLDLGSLTAQIAYTRRFGPIMAGPVPIVPFVGGSISVEGRLAMGFDSRPQTLAVQALSHPGAVDELVANFSGDGMDIITQGFYLDDLDADGVDVPEVKVVTTLEAGAGVSIGIVTAGLKGGITLTINLDINDPDDDGRLRTAEIRSIFEGKPECVFDVSAELEAFISVFVSIELLLTSLDYEFDLLRLGPYTLFEYGCPPVNPDLVVQAGNALALTSGSRSSERSDSATDVSDDFEVRQFDSDGGAAAGGTTDYEVSGFGLVQRVSVTTPGSGYHVAIYESGIAISSEIGHEFDPTTLPTFTADGGAAQDRLSFLTGETYDDDKNLVATEFTTRVAGLTGGLDNDLLVTGAGNDTGIDGGEADDSIDTGLGNDVASGGVGDDVVGGGAGRDDLYGGDGADHLEGGPGADRAAGGLGNDGLVGGPGRDVRAVLVLPTGAEPGIVAEQVRLGFDSGDVLVGGGGADAVDGGDGSDVVVGGDQSSLTTGDMGTLFQAGTRMVNVLEQGSTNPDPRSVAIDTATIPSDSELDPLCNSGTALSGLGNSDYVTGGPEHDVVVGGNGPDRLDGGAGEDEICGRAGDDQASGDGASDDDEDNADVIRGGHGNDRLEGGLGEDVVLGDDASFFRSGARVLDGTLGNAADGTGADYVDGGDGDDVLSGGGGTDLLLGGEGNDVASGEGRDTVENGGGAPSVADRLLACNVTTRVVDGRIDLNGDLLAGAGDEDVAADDGRLAGLAVDDGVVRALDAPTAFSGLLGDVVIVDGLVDLDRDGTAGAGDTGMVPLASVLATATANTDGDCILAEEGDDQLLGGTGSDYLGAGDGTDLALGGDGNDLLLGDDGVDVGLGGPHHDVIVGGLGEDHLQGENGDDRLRGNEGADDLVGGSDTSGADDGQDVLLGGREIDVLAAENAKLVNPAVATAVTAAPWGGSGLVPAAARAGAGSPLRYAGSAVVCGTAPAARWATLLASDGQAGTPVQSPGTPLAYDELYGGFDCDWVFGSEGDDVVRGGQDDDVVEGGPGADLAQGDDGRDVVLGGSSVDHRIDQQVTLTRSGAGVPDEGDTILGDGGPDGFIGADLLAGDNSLPIRVGSSYVLKLHDVATTSAPLGSASGGDVVTGGGGEDRVFGQGGGDTITTGAVDDYVEGNDGDDTINGGAGQDDLIGGSSARDGLPLGGTGIRLTDTLAAAPYDASAAGVRDGEDEIDGGDGADVVLGDNGRITRPPSRQPAAPGAAVRDIATTDESVRTSAGVHAGADLVQGGDGDDRVFGQDDGDDVRGGGGTDHLEGGAGSDDAEGDAGDDVVIGGSSVSPAGDGQLGSLPTVAFPDAGDRLYGDDVDSTQVGQDRIFGDNATVLPPSSQPIVRLSDVAGTTAPAAGTSGGDTIEGGGSLGTAGADHVFGQGGNDTITTAGGPDYVEGSSGDDTITSGGGDDDVIGGSSALDGRPYGATGIRLTDPMTPRRDADAAGVADGVDTVRAGLGDDTVLGDNGRITRPASGPSPDVAMADVAAGVTSGSDQLYGGGDHDVLYGQLDDGTATGWGSGDRLEGGAGNDALLGDLAVVVRTRAEDITGDRTLLSPGDGIKEEVLANGSIVARTWVPESYAQVGGPDLALGGAGDDALHLGGGIDLGNGDAGSDAVFGGDADDALWGGTDHDRIFGGYGADDLDVKVRSGEPGVFNTVRGIEDRDAPSALTHNGPDLVYGGWGPDELQADVGSTGQQPQSDQLIDWVGAHNVYYVCGGAYGEGRVIRQSSPAVEKLLLDLARSLGAEEGATKPSGGWFDVGMVYNSDMGKNTQKSPEHPGHNTCT